MDGESYLQWRHDSREFDSLYEAETWADSIYNEIGNLYDGYTTADRKVAYALTFLLGTRRDWQETVRTFIDRTQTPVRYCVIIIRQSERGE